MTSEVGQTVRAAKIAWLLESNRADATGEDISDERLKRIYLLGRQSFLVYKDPEDSEGEDWAKKHTAMEVSWSIAPCATMAAVGAATHCSSNCSLVDVILREN